MSIGIVSVRYARALLSFAEENGCQQEVYESMARLSSCIKTFPEMMGRLNDPTVLPEDKVTLLLTAVTDENGAEPCPQLKDFFSLVVKAGRESALPFIASSYRDSYRKANHIIPVEMTFATPITDAKRSKLQHIIESKANGTVEWSEKVDPGILGGFILQVDDHCLDASVSRRLRTIEKELLEKNSRII